MKIRVLVFINMNFDSILSINTLEERYLYRFLKKMMKNYWILSYTVRVNSIISIFWCMFAEIEKKID